METNDGIPVNFGGKFSATTHTLATGGGLTGRSVAGGCGGRAGWVGEGWYRGRNEDRGWEGCAVVVVVVGKERCRSDYISQRPPHSPAQNGRSVRRFVPSVVCS